jgi:phosphatidylethanolamine/phosphatidyl-N-methylethanolamine N-methyltransferase
MGSLVPSSKVLGRAMAEQLAALGPEEYVVELGPGSGAVTRALCEAGIAQKRLLVIERDHAFIALLKQEFPEALILLEDATNLEDVLKKYNIRQVAAVVSSLPLLSLPAQVCEAIVHASFRVLKKEGIFVQFTYGLFSPVPAQHQQAVGISGRIVKRIWRNFPPARVWRYTANAAA